MHKLLLSILLCMCSYYSQANMPLRTDDCFEGSRLADTKPNEWADTSFYDHRYCIMAKKPSSESIAALIDDKQAYDITQRYTKTFKSLKTDDERVAFVDLFIQELSKIVWVTVSYPTKDHVGLSITAKAPAEWSSDKYHIAINLFNGEHDVLLPKLNEYIDNYSYDGVKQNIKDSVNFVLFGSIKNELL